MKPKALVLAGNSFLGRHLCDCLRARGMAVVPTTRRGALGTLPCDVTAAADVRRVLAASQPDWVFSCAAATSPNVAPTELYAVHVMGTLNLLEAMSESTPEATAVLFGSAAEYGAVPEEALPVGESYKEAPTSFFGASKLTQTHLALASARERGLRVLVLRPFNLLGPGLPGHYLATALARRLLAEEGIDEPFAVTNGHATRDFVDVRDVAEAAVLLVEWGRARPGEGQVFNVASGQETAVLDVAAKLCAMSGRRRAVDAGIGPSRSGVTRSRGDASRARAAGWVPRIDWEQSLEDLWRATYSAPTRPTRTRVKQPLP